MNELQEQAKALGVDRDLLNSLDALREQATWLSSVDRAERLYALRGEVERFRTRRLFERTQDALRTAPGENVVQATEGEVTHSSELHAGSKPGNEPITTFGDRFRARTEAAAKKVRNLLRH